MIARLRVSGFLAAAIWLATVSCLAFGQTAPPADTDQALRARVTEFLQGFVDRQFRKLLPLVADATQEEFFAMSKAELKSFKLEAIDYNSDFTKAKVHLTVMKIWHAEGNEFLAQEPLDLTWKIEKGSWVWYHELENDTIVTAMGPSDIAKIMQGVNGQAPALPKMSQSVIDSMGKNLLVQPVLDKSTVTLAAGKTSSEVVTVHNQARGAMLLSLNAVPKIPGFTATLDKTTVQGGEEAKLSLRYDPPDPSTKPEPALITVVVSPFGQELNVKVDFAPTN